MKGVPVDQDSQVTIRASIKEREREKEKTLPTNCKYWKTERLIVSAGWKLSCVRDFSSMKESFILNLRGKR